MRLAPKASRGSEMEVALYTVAGFVLGAVPFSLLVGKWLLLVALSGTSPFTL